MIIKTSKISLTQQDIVNFQKAQEAKEEIKKKREKQRFTKVSHNKSVRICCPKCSTTDRANLIRLRQDFYECRVCKKTFVVDSNWKNHPIKEDFGVDE